MKYYINSETMRVKWMASIFTVFKGHMESLLCQSVGKRWTHSSNNEKPAIKKRPRVHEAVNSDSLREEELYLWDLQGLPLGYTVPCRALNSSVSHTTKRALAGTKPCCLVTTTGGMSHNLQSITPWNKAGNGGPGGPRDGQGLVCCCTSTGQFLRSSGYGHRKAGAWQHCVCEGIPEYVLFLSLHHDCHPSLGTRAVWGAGVFTQLVMVNWLPVSSDSEAVDFFYCFQWKQAFAHSLTSV